MTRVNEATVSKSARKREHLALQALGEKLIELPVTELEILGLDEPLLDAIVDAKSIRSHGALRRQRQLIGKLMRNANAARIEALLQSYRKTDRLATALFHAAEEWRERICNEGDVALAAFAELTRRDQPGLSSLLREHRAATSEAGKRALRRRLFREIHGELTRTSTQEAVGE